MPGLPLKGNERNQNTLSFAKNSLFFLLTYHIFSSVGLEMIEDHLVLFAKCHKSYPSPFSDIVKIYWLRWSFIHSWQGYTLQAYTECVWVFNIH